MDLHGTLLKINEKDRLTIRLENLDKEEYILENEEKSDVDADVEVKYVNGTKRLVWTLIGSFIIIYAIFLDKRFENVDFWNGFFVIGILVLCAYVAIMLIQHSRGKNILMTHSKLKATLKEIELQKEESEQKELAKKARIQEIKHEQRQLKATIKLIEEQLEDSIVPPMYRQAIIIKHFMKNIDNLRAKTLRDAIRIYNEEKRRHERDNHIVQSKELRKSLETISSQNKNKNK